MVDKPKHLLFYKELAQSAAFLSYANRKKVGCVIVKDGNILSYGYNGTCSGFDNVCEDENGNTKPEVIHAEFNAIAKVASSNQSCKGADLIVTLSPCVECAKLIIQSGIKTVYYVEDYRNSDGKELLQKAKIETIKL